MLLVPGLEVTLAKLSQALGVSAANQTSSGPRVLVEQHLARLGVAATRFVGGATVIDNELGVPSCLVQSALSELCCHCPCQLEHGLLE